MTGLFPSVLDAVIFYSVLILFLGSELVRFGFLIPRSQRGMTKKPAHRGPTIPIAIGTIVTLVLDFWLGYVRIIPLPDLLLYPGVALIIVGFIVRQWAISTLGRFHFGPVQLSTDHKLITKGPYRLVRHPSYAGSILEYLGLAFALQSGGALAATIAFYFLPAAYRIHGEEKVLSSEFGEEYAAYRRRTKRLIPYFL